MDRKKQVPLCVELDGKRRYICVPISRAKDLHIYLRTNHVRSAPPQPSFTGFDSIELAPDIDVDGVQELLNKFEKETSVKKPVLKKEDARALR